MWEDGCESCVASLSTKPGRERRAFMGSRVDGAEGTAKEPNCVGC